LGAPNEPAGRGKHCSRTTIASIFQHRFAEIAQQLSFWVGRRPIDLGIGVAHNSSVEFDHELNRVFAPFLTQMRFRPFDQTVGLWHRKRRRSRSA
jgi:hypothetical protein